jgi:hypothetical protein
MTVREIKNQSKSDIDQFEAVESVFAGSAGTMSEKLDAFPKFASRQALAKFLARYEIFQRILSVNGSIIECGVLHGGGLLTFAKLSSILEPVNHTRKIIGFDTFAGFPSIHDEDRKGSSSHLLTGGLRGSPLQDVQAAVDLYDKNRPLSHIGKVKLVEGDITKTAPCFVEENPHLVVALLYLDLDLYEPTLCALETFLPRMPKGAIVAFDELNAEIFPGETAALQKAIGISNLRIERFSFDPYISFAAL